MAYNNLTSRTDVAALIPEEVSRALVNRLPEDSAALQMFRRIPVSRNQVRFPVLSALPVAYWVTGDTGLKQTTEINWTNKFLNIEEIAVIMPFPDNVVADMESDLWDSAEPYVREAFGRTLDSAIFFGTNAPGSFPTNISAAALAAGNSVNEGNTAAEGGFYGDIDEVIAAVEDDGFDVSGFVAARSARGRFRTARKADGDKMDAGRLNGTLTELDGLPVAYPMRGLFPAGGASNTNVRLFAGDWDQFVLAVRDDISIKILTEAVIQDGTGAIIYNLAQQDMTAVRVTFRVGWQVSNLLNFDRPTESERYPVARLMY